MNENTQKIMTDLLRNDRGVDRKSVQEIASFTGNRRKCTGRKKENYFIFL